MLILTEEEEMNDEKEKLRIIQESENRSKNILKKLLQKQIEKIKKNQK